MSLIRLVSFTTRFTNRTFERNFSCPVEPPLYYSIRFCSLRLLHLLRFVYETQVAAFNTQHAQHVQRNVCFSKGTKEDSVLFGEISGYSLLRSNFRFGRALNSYFRVA